MPLPLEMPKPKPKPILLPPGPSYPHRTHTRSESRASPSRPRITDDLLSDLSPNTTLAAFTSPSSPSSGKLKASIEAASPGEREFGIRAATAANKIKEWVNELQDWPWPKSGSAGFEAPASQHRKLRTPNQDSFANGPERRQHGHEDQGPTDNDVQEDLYWGSLHAQDVIKYSTRIDEILDDMDDLDVGGIKSHILDLHVPGRSRPSSSASATPSSMSSLSSYQKMDDFTAIITATVLQALPFLARLQILMDVWGIRLILLRQINPLMDALEDAEAAVRSGWRVLDISVKGIPEGNSSHATGKQQHLSRDSFNTMQQVLQSKVTRIGQKLDRMLDSLEGRQDTLPDAWLDRMDLLERRYADWVTLANRKVLEGEWEKKKISAKEPAKPTENDDSKTSNIQCSKSGNDTKAQAPPTSVPNRSLNGGKILDHDASDERIDAVEISSLAGEVSIAPQNTLSLISQLDGAKEIPEDRAPIEPITPQTATTTISRSLGNETGNISPTTPPSSKFSSAVKMPPSHSLIDQHKVNNSKANGAPIMADFEHRSKNQPKLETKTEQMSKATDKPDSTKSQSSAKKGNRVEARESPATPRRPESSQPDTVSDRNTDASPTTPRTSITSQTDATDTAKSLQGLSETPSDFSPMPSVISTDSSYGPSDSSSPSANGVPPYQQTRRVLSPIQSSADWFDFGDVKTPTKGALREDPNASNLLSPKQDGQKTPTLNENTSTHRKIMPVRERLDDEERKTGDNPDDSGRGIRKNDTGAASGVSTPDPKFYPILSFDEASPDGALPPLPPASKRKSLHLLDSPDFSTPFKIPETPLEPPILPNISVLDVPRIFSPTKGSADQLQQQISEILESLPARIRLTTEAEKNPFPDLKIPKKRPAIKKTVSTSSLRLPSRSPTPTPSFTLAPAYSKNSPRPRHLNSNPEIKLYHLSRSNGGAPIKLFVRLVGENGERVMVRVGGGWADLGEYLREYAIHHSRRNAPEDKIHIHDSSSRIVSSSSISSARNGRSSPVGRSASSMDGPISRPATSLGYRRASSTQHERPVSSLAIRKNRNPRKSVGEDARQTQYRSPSTPMPVMNRKAVGKEEDTPPSARSSTSRTSSRLSFSGEDSYLGLSGPRSKHKELSEESEKWVESMTEKVKQASAEKEKKQQNALLGDLGKAGSTKRLFRKN